MNDTTHVRTFPRAGVLTGARFDETRANLAAVYGAGLGDQSLVDRAIEVAVDCHLDQKDRPDGSPYLQHVSSVARRVLGWHPEPSAELAAAALLHDSMEDQARKLVALDPELTPSDDPETTRDLARAALTRELGERVAEMVDALTNPPFRRMVEESHGFGPDEAAHDAMVLLRYTEHFVELIMRDEETALIKLADFADNALRLDFVRAHRPGRYHWLVRKYGPCVAFLREALPAMPADHPLRRAWSAVKGDVEVAWLRDFAPRS